MELAASHFPKLMPDDLVLLDRRYQRKEFYLNYKPIDQS